jgi:hypothetical protein
VASDDELQEWAERNERGDSPVQEPSLFWWLLLVLGRRSLRGWRSVRLTRRDVFLVVFFLAACVFVVWAMIDGDREAGCSLFKPFSCEHVRP